MKANEHFSIYYSEAWRNAKRALARRESRAMPLWLQATLSAACAVVFQLASLDVYAQSRERSGKEVVDSVCGNCHASGANGAPRIGDKKAWSKLSSRGLTGLSKQALNGIRKMPPHGARMDLTDTEIERAVTYMVNESGGNWNAPVSRKEPQRTRSGEEIVNMQCSKCHQEGKGGAPKIGDRKDWIPRLTNGFDYLVRSAINGHGAMPARGGIASLTDHEIRGAIVYMYNPGTAR
jgi:cytochrome c5